MDLIKMNIYENDELIKQSGGIFHPGGSELTERALKLSALPVHASVLDVGCGLGAAVDLMRSNGLQAVGIDASRKLVSLADSEYISYGLAEKIGEHGTRYDAIMTECVFCLLDKPAFLTSARQALRPGGKLILCELYRKEGPPTAVLSRKELEDLLSAHGFRLTSWNCEDRAWRSYYAQLIMDFGPDSPIITEMTGCCAGSSGESALSPETLRRLKLGYAISVWML